MTKFFHPTGRFAQKSRQRPALSKASALPCAVAGFSTSCDASGPFGNNIEVSFFPNAPASVSGTTFGNGVTLRAGVTFVPISNNPVTDITFRVDGPGGGFDQCQVDIYATSGGLPTGASLGTSNAFTFSFTAEYKKFTFATPVAVTSGVTYAAVLSRTGAQNGSNAYDVGVVGTGVGGTNGLLSENSSNVWSASATVFPLFWVGTSAYKYWAIGRDVTTATTLKAIGADDPSKSWPYAVYKTGFATSINTIFTRQYRDILHIVISDGATNYKYQTFDMKTGTFVTAETIASALTIVTSAQCSVVVRQELPAGEVVVHFNGTAVSSHARTYYSRRTAAATWSAAVQIDPGSPSTTDFNNQSSVLGQSDRVHFLYTDNTTGAGYHRSLDNSNTMDTNSSQTTVQPNGVQPVSYRTGASTVKVQNSNQAGAIAEMHFDSGANPAIGVQTVTQTGRTPSSPHRTFVDIDEVTYTYYASYILYVDSVNNDIYATKSTDHGLNWDTTGSIVIYSGTVSTGGLNFCIGSVPYVRGGNVVIPMIFVEGGAHKYYEYTLRSAAVQKKIDATSPGSYSLTAPVATLLRHGWAMGATAAGSYSLTAPVATLLRHGWNIPAGAVGANYTLTGQTTTLLRKGWRLVATTPASYTLTGQVAKLSQALTASAGSYSLTAPVATLLRKGWRLNTTASVGSYSLTAPVATLLRHGWALPAGVTSYALTGVAATLGKGFIVGPGAYSLVGASTTLVRHGWVVNAQTAGSYALTGQAVTLTKGAAPKVIAATAGSYALTGTNVGLAKGFVVGAGSYSLTVPVATLLRHGWRVNAQTAGSYAVTGSNVSLRQTLTATTAGAYSLLGQTVKLSQALVASAGSYSLTAPVATALRKAWRLVVTTPASYALTGTAARVAHGYNIVAGTASYALTGTDVALVRPTTKIITALAGSYALTGQTARLAHGYNIVAGTTSYALTGQTAALTKGKIIAAGVASYALTGTPAGVLHTWKLIAGVGSYVLTPQTTLLRKGWRVPAGVASYALTGTAAGTLHGWRVTAALSTYALTGINQTLTKGKVLATLVPASYLLSPGNVVGLAKGLTASAGSYALTGAATTKLLKGWHVVAGVGSYTLTGTAAGVLHGWKLPAGVTSYALTGQPASLERGRKVTALAGSYVLTGTDAALVKAAHNTIVAQAGSYALTGTDAVLRKSKSIVASVGSYTLTGTAAGLRRGRMLPANSNSYLLTGTPVTLRKGWRVPAGVASYALTDQPASLERGRNLTAGTASYTLTGQPVTFSKSVYIYPSLFLDPDQFFTHNVKYNQTLVATLFLDPDQFFTHDIYTFYGDTEVMVVPQEIRDMVLDFEDRLLVVEPEDRAMEAVAEDRAMIVPPQPRESDVDRSMEVLDEETMMNADVRRRA